jgi:mannose/cellobiose epimerase-like protein (N-acyl-D-glucosamine 2-epimerase family)
MRHAPRFVGGLVSGALLLGGSAWCQAQGTAELRAVAPAIAANLENNVLAFWYPATVDREHGGFLIDHDAAGRFKGEAPKAIVTQARMVWLSARLVRDGRGGDQMRAAARQGYRFLMDRLWDREHGGFFWEVDRTGATVVAPNKHLYGQAFGLYALAEYARATGDAAALADARRLFDLLEQRAYDAEFGGYREFFARDWTRAPADVRPYLGGSADWKLMNTHLHLMEALSVFYRVDRSPRVALRLGELIGIQSNAVVRKAVGACTDRYRRDWTPILDDAESARASYGHDLENIWLIVDALEALGQPTAPYHDLFRQLFAYSMRHGYDREQGGFYDSGPLGQAADRRVKVWWVQAEALVSALTMYSLTRDPEYARVFLQTWAFTDRVLTDWKAGEWHPTIAADGTPTGEKAHRWKAGYHNGRALLESLRLIAALDR